MGGLIGDLGGADRRTRSIYLLHFYPLFPGHKIHIYEKILATHELKRKKKNQSAGAHLTNKLKL